jgi:hypothetical protein
MNISWNRGRHREEKVEMIEKKKKKCGKFRENALITY